MTDHNLDNLLRFISTYNPRFKIYEKINEPNTNLDLCLRAAFPYQSLVRLNSSKTVTLKFKNDTQIELPFSILLSYSRLYIDIFDEFGFVKEVNIPIDCPKEIKDIVREIFILGITHDIIRGVRNVSRKYGYNSTELLCVIVNIIDHLQLSIYS